LRFSCELIPVQVQRRGGARFRVIFHAPLAPDPTLSERRAQALDLTRRLNFLFESWIRARPGEWLCSKRRWREGARHQIVVKR
ncbi:MAG: lauroyl acyltransferase, partial [Gammaproteobacteria bacterium]